MNAAAPAHQTIDPQAAQQMIGQADAIRQRLELVNQQLGLLTEMLADKQQARTAVASLADAKVGDEILLPVGGGTFVHVTLADTEKVVKGVGADYATDRTTKVALDELDEDIKALEADATKMRESAQKLEANYRQIEAMIQQMQGSHPQAP